MRISNNRVSESSINQNFQVRTSKTNTVQKDYNSFRVELSPKALASKEYNDIDETLFPIHNPDALQYTERLDIILY